MAAVTGVADDRHCRGTRTPASFTIIHRAATNHGARHTKADTIMFIFAPLLAFSGHMGSGKDTVAKAVVDHSRAAWTHRSFADPLRAEIGEVIAAIQRVDTREQARFAVAMEQLQGRDPTGKPQCALRSVVDTLFDDVKAGRVHSASDRTDSMRHALQVWGTDVRRATDPNYWLQPMHDILMDDLSHSQAVYVTDARFPNELDLIDRLDGYTIRLNVSDETQAERLRGRDGIVVTDAMRRHPSETAADGYPDFDLVIDTDHRTVDSMADEIIGAFGLL